ncbi:MAG: hypothetical protein ACI97A_000253 [Planctomycetota bacterium]|jgi:hypothetical protein
MTQSQSLSRESVGGEMELSAERRRARILGRILESSHRFHERHQVPEIMQALVGISHDLFADSELLLLAKSRLLDQEELEVFHNDLSGAELAFAKRLASEVSETGVPPFSAEFNIISERHAGCVPLRIGDEIFGALYVTVPFGTLGSADELTYYLRLISLQASLSLNTATNIKRLGEELEIMTTDAGVNLTEEDIPLTVAKRAFERWLISARLAHTNGNIAAAARALKMDRGQLSRLVKRHNIDPTSYRP